MSDRDEFEAWVCEDGDPILEPYTWGSEDGRYGDVETQIAWEAWQATRRWRPIEEAPHDEPVILMCDVHGNRWTGIYPDHDAACGYLAEHFQYLPEPPNE